MSTLVYVALGSNLDDRERHLQAGVDGMAGLPDTRVLAVSSVFETDPEGGAAEPEYWNAAAVLSTSLEPHALLHALQRIEADQGRPAPGTGRGGPRTLDLDLLLYGDRVVGTTELTVPHPRMAVRSFVLAPLDEIADHIQHPVLGRTIGELRSSLGARSEVRRLSVRLNTMARAR